MRKRFLPCLAVFGLLAFALPVRAADAETAGPTVVVRLQPIDQLLENVKYLVNLADREEEAKQFEGLIKSMTGPKGIQGIDTKRPIGLYGKVGAAGIDSTVVVLVPIADEKAFLELLEGLNVKATKGEDDVYVVKAEQSPVPVYFRFANHYAYATAADKNLIAKDKLLPPNQVIPADAGGVASIVVHLDQVPENLKQIALTQLELQLSNAKDKEEKGETKVQHEFKVQMLDNIFGHLTALVRDGSEVKVNLNIDRQKGTLSAEVSLAGKPKSKLAMSIAELGRAQSLFAGLLGKNDAVSALVHVGSPDSVRKAFGPVLDESLRKELEKEKDETKRQQAEKFLKALEPTLKAGEIDFGLSMRGPSGNGHYTLVAGLKIKDGEALEKALRDVIKDLPEQERAKIQVDADAAGNVKIHRIEAKDADAEAKRILGSNAIYVAVRSDALLAAAGENGLSALKEAIALQPKAGPPILFELSLAQLAQAMAKEQKAAPEAAKKAFAADRDGGKIRFAVEGGNALRLRLDMRASVVKFLSLLEKADKKAE